MTKKCKSHRSVEKLLALINYTFALIKNNLWRHIDRWGGGVACKQAVKGINEIFWCYTVSFISLLFTNTDAWYGRLVFWAAACLNRLCYRFSSAALLCAETGAHINQSHVYVCVCFSSSEQPALRHHGRTASSGVSKCGAALLPPNQVRVSLQPQPRSPVEQQWLDWCFWGTHARSGFSGNLRKNFQFRFDWTVGSNLYTLYFVFLTA